jgi:uncharacterized protein (TIRG00374 family)
MKRKINGKFIYNFILALLIICVFAYFCISKDGLIDLSKNAKQFTISWLIVAILFNFIYIGIDAILTYLFTFKGEKKYTIKNAIKTSLVGQFFNAVTPSASGGQPMQIYVMSKQGVGTGMATSALIQKFLVYQNVLVAYSIFAIILKFSYFSSLDKYILLGAILGFTVQACVIVVLILFSFNEKATIKLISAIYSVLAKLHIIKDLSSKIDGLKKQLSAFHEGNRKLYKDKSLLIKTYIFTFLQLTSMFVIPYFVYLSFNLSGASLIDIICAQAFVTMTTSFFPIPGASGATEGAGLIFLGGVFTKETIKPAVVIFRLISYYLTVLVSAPFAYLTKGKKTEQGISN